MGGARGNVPIRSLRLSVLEERLAVCRPDPGSETPAWALAAPYFSVTRTADELSVVCSEHDVPPEVLCERGWRALKLEGPFEFGKMDMLPSVAVPLAEREVSILAIATYDTDYAFVQESQLNLAGRALRERGREIR